MKLIKWIFVSLFIASLAYATGSFVSSVHHGNYPTYPRMNGDTGKQAELIKRGEYLVKMGDCIACHTKPDGKPFAGGLPIETPFGTIYTPNITPDKETGIGKWSTKNFIKAMHKGISPKGKYYYPAFPYLYFNKITDQDLIAIKAYLDAIPAIKQQNRKNRIMFPLNWRFLQLGWRVLFFYFQNTGPYKNDTSKSADWNRGKYLVEGLGHCGLCHTPSHYLLFKKWNLAAPIQKYDLTGAFVHGFYAPNITSTNLKNTPINEIANVFLKNKLIGDGKVEGIMAEVNHDSLKYLTPSDIDAIATYLKSIKSEVPPKGTCMSCSTQEIQAAVQYIVSESKPGMASAMGHKTKPTPSKALTIEDGKNIYNRYCKACHDGSYEGAPKLGDKQAWKPLIDQGIETLIQRTIEGYNNMPKRGSCADCSNMQLKSAVIYMVQESKTSGDYILWLKE